MKGYLWLAAAVCFPLAAHAQPPGDDSWLNTSASDVLSKSKDPLRRESAALVIGQRGSTADLPLLIERLAKDDNPWVRAGCAEALGLIGDPAAITPLKNALSREQDQRLRREVALALLRLGQREGLLELMWQLGAGTNYSRADAMKALVRITGRPLGQRATDWWSYLGAGGYKKLDVRKPGSPSIIELPGATRVFGDRGTWQTVPAIVLRLRPTRAPITRRTLAQHEQHHGPIADGCLIILHSAWSEAPSQKRSEHNDATGKNATGKNAPPPLRGPGLTADAVAYLLQRAPKLLGVGIDAPQLDLPSLQQTQPVRTLLLKNQRLVLEGLGGLQSLNATGTRVMIFRSPDNKPHILAILP